MDPHPHLSASAERFDIRGLEGSLARLRDEAILGMLSETERAQLGTPIGSARYVTAEEWTKLRPILVERDKRRRPGMDPELSAYTPGETLQLLEHPAISSWHRAMRRFTVPDDCRIVAFVPCAATKPWDTATRGIYASYNALRAEVASGRLPPVYFVTISEPLGVVPEERWGSFPQYENPGLFSDPAQRSGMIASDWKALFGERLVVPFDTEAYGAAIGKLASVIAAFARRNASEGRVFVSFVENLPGQRAGSHSDMLSAANAIYPFLRDENRFRKRAAARTPPLKHVREKLMEVAERELA